MGTGAPRRFAASVVRCDLLLRSRSQHAPDSRASDPQSSIWFLIPKWQIRIGQGATVAQGLRMSLIQVFLAQSHGVASRAELLASGFSPGQIQRARESGKLRTAVPGVYVAATHSPDSWATRCLVALKHAGVGAAAVSYTHLSVGSAAR